MTPSYRGRFAPTPSGPLHFGSLVAAVASYVDARANGGEWLLRIDDLDTPRVAPHSAQRIMSTLRAHGLIWDEPVVWQSQQRERYQDAFARLADLGLLYGCRCSRETIRQVARAGPVGPIYPGTCRDAGLAPGQRDTATRIHAGDQALRTRDGVHGELQWPLQAELGDFVVRRRDGLHAYALAVVVDDNAAGITHVVRGSDLLPLTAGHLLLQNSLRWPSPHYAHVPTAVDAAGRKLSKQSGAKAVDDRMAPANLSACLGFLGHPVPPRRRNAGSAEILAWATESWDLSRVPKETTLDTPTGA